MQAVALRAVDVRGGRQTMEDSCGAKLLEPPRAPPAVALRPKCAPRRSPCCCMRWEPAAAAVRAATAARPAMESGCRMAGEAVELAGHHGGRRGGDGDGGERRRVQLPVARKQRRGGRPARREEDVVDRVVVCIAEA